MNDRIMFDNGSDKQSLVSTANPLPTVLIGSGAGVALTKSVVTMDGTSKQILASNSSRSIVYVFSTTANASVGFDPTGGTAALDSGLPLDGGGGYVLTGVAAQSAMTAIGTAGNKLTIYTG